MPTALAGPVEVMLSRPVEQVPAESALPGGCRYEPKFDGYRCCIVRTKARGWLWSRQGRELSSAFPDIVAAAEFHLPPGTVLDGELCVWDGGRLNFDLLQLRAARRHGPAILAAVREHPASYVAFDLLAEDGHDIRAVPLRGRRTRLQRVARGWAPPLELVPSTSSRAEALAWFEDYRAAGVEGLVVKAAAGRYVPGSREWQKIKNRQTREVIVGAVTGTLGRPLALIAGLYAGGELVIAGRSTALTQTQSAQLGAQLTAAAPGHPWPERISSGVFGTRQMIDIIRTQPLVVEVAADPARTGRGAYRHPLRYVRIRTDLTPEDIATLDTLD